MIYMILSCHIVIFHLCPYLKLCVFYWCHMSIVIWFLDILGIFTYLSCWVGGFLKTSKAVEKIVQGIGWKRQMLRFLGQLPELNMAMACRCEMTFCCLLNSYEIIIIRYDSLIYIVVQFMMIHSRMRWLFGDSWCMWFYDETDLWPSAVVTSPRWPMATLYHPHLQGHEDRGLTIKMSKVTAHVTQRMWQMYTSELHVYFLCIHTLSLSSYTLSLSLTLSLSSVMCLTLSLSSGSMMRWSAWVLDAHRKTS